MTDDVTLDRPAALIDGVAAETFEAFNAMQSTKQRHYALLSRLDDKRSRYGLVPTLRDSALLAALLADHDAQVGRFTLASRLLKDTDPQAHRALFGYIAAIGEVDGDERRH